MTDYHIQSKSGAAAPACRSSGHGGLRTSVFGAGRLAALVGFAVAGLAWSITGSADAQTSARVHNVTVTLTGVRAGTGVIRTVLCAPSEQFPNTCRRTAVQRAVRGTNTFVFRGVPTGSSAFAAFHDADGDGDLDMGQGGRPREGLGFSNNAISMAGPPQFRAASFEVRRNTAIRVTLRNW